MHILFIADGRSPIARRWIKGVAALSHRVTLVTTFPCTPIEGVEAIYMAPVAFSNFGGSQAASSDRSNGQAGALRKMVSRSRRLFLSMRHIFGPLTLPFYSHRVNQIIKKCKPDLVHALRLPFEGMLAAASQPTVPLAVSIWGNDLTLHAGASPFMRMATVRTLRRANGLLADVRRDLRLAPRWGFNASRPTLMAPGNGGIDLGEMLQMTLLPNEEIAGFSNWDVPLVVMPRGIRPGYVQNDVFFQAIPLVLQRSPEVHFLCPSMAGQKEAVSWSEKLNLSRNVHLLPYLPQYQLWDIFHRSQVTVSVTTHDGTPNTLIEAMACGCFPIVGDIEALREWITGGVNGLLVEPTKPAALAEAILLALDNPIMRSRAAEINLRLIQQRAEISLVRAQMEVFYQRLVGK